MLKFLWRGASSAFLHVFLLSLASPGSTVKETGFLSAYGRVPTDATLALRQEWDQLPQDITRYEVLIAVRDCRRIGEDAMLHTDAGSFRALIFDCAGIQDGGYEWMVSNNYAAEADWYFWQLYPDLIGSVVTVEYGLARLPQVKRNALNGSTYTSNMLKNAPGANFVPFPYKRPPVLTQSYSPSHLAIDVAAGCGAILLAPFDGRIAHNGTDGFIGPYSYGQENSMLTIVGGDFSMTLLHGRYLPELGRTVQNVRKGEMLGYESNIGNTTGPTGCHSHIILRKKGEIVDPDLWMR